MNPYITYFPVLPKKRLNFPFFPLRGLKGKQREWEGGAKKEKEENKNHDILRNISRCTCKYFDKFFQLPVDVINGVTASLLYPRNVFDQPFYACKGNGFYPYGAIN